MDNEKWNPGKLLELSGGYWKTCVLQTGVKLDVFTAIGKDKLTNEDIAKKIKVNTRALGMLLNALVSMELLIKEGQAYINTPAGIAFLSKDSQKYIGYMIMHQHDMVASWAQLDKAIITGKTIRENVTQRDNEKLENFLMGMFNIATSTAPKVAKTISLSGRKHLLDLGGGPGTYSIHFCMSNPDLNATVCDLSATRPFAEKTIDKFDLSDRVDFQDVDFLKDDIPGSYDVAWLSHILHGEGPDSCQRIIKKTVAVLKPGGIVIIHDFILNNAMDGPEFAAIFSLNMLLGTEKGQSYSQEQLCDMLQKSGVKDIKRISIELPNDSGILMGIV